MQLVDSAFTACMQCTGFTTGTLDFMQLVDSAFDSMYAAHRIYYWNIVLYFLFCVWTLRFYAASG